VILCDITLKGLRNRLNPILTVFTLVLAAYYTFQLDQTAPAGLFHGMLAIDGFAQFFKLFLLLAALLVVLGSLHSSELAPFHQGEFFALLLAVTLGMVLLANSTNLAMLYLSLELVSLTSYIMVGYLKTDRLSNEASLKYILFGAISTGSMLYGLSLIYGMTGSLNLYTIRDAFLNQGVEGVDQFTVLLILVLTMAGFGFKTAAVPFHFWCPDVYAGAATPVTAFLSVAPKAAGFAVLARFFFSGMSQTSGSQWSMIGGINWPLVLIGISVLTMTLGNVAALTQNNLKRMLAYSSIAHGGYLLVGLVSANDVGKAAILFYLLAYAVTNVAAFGVIALLGTRDRANDELRDFAGLWHTRPGLAALMTVCLLSLGGLPPTVGFIGKWYVFSAAVSAGYYGLAVIGVLTSVVSVFFYLRIAVMMYMTDGSDIVRPRVPLPAAAGLALATLAVIYLGVLPARIIALALDSISTIF